jgi:ribosome modulation factor
MSEDDMVEGYRDGLDDDRAECPASMSNRSHSYRHGWLNGRDDRLRKPRASAAELRILADLALAQDEIS